MGVKIMRKQNGVVWCLLPIGNDSLRQLHARGLDVRELDLSNQDMREVNLFKLIATGCKMVNTDLLYARLRYAVLNRADLRGAKFDYCDLTSAVFCKSDLRGASFRHSNLYCADFGDAIIDETTCFNGCVNRETASFRKLDPRGSKGRERCVEPVSKFSALDTVETESQLREKLALLRIELTNRPSERLLCQFNLIRKQLNQKINAQTSTEIQRKYAPSL